MSVNSQPVVIQSIHGVAFIRFEVPRIDHDNFEEIHKYILAYLDEHQPIRVVANLRKVEYLHSMGIGLLVGMVKHVHAYQGKIRFCSMQTEVHELLTITRMHDVFEVFDTEKEATAGF